MAAKFEVYKNRKGEFRFRMRSANGQVIAQGESYKTKKSCMNGIASIKKNAPKAKIVDTT